MNPPENSLPPDFRTDYLGHDAEYRRRRERGWPGWDGDPRSQQQTYAAIAEFVPDAALPSPATILEFGCGAGDLMFPWAVKGHRVAGVDISPYAIDWAREKAAALNRRVDLFVGDVTRELHLPLPPADLVLDGHCLHCIIGADRLMFFRNAWECLKPGGLLHVNTMCGEPHLPIRSDYVPACRCVVSRGIATRYFGPSRSILEEITTAGFQIEKHRVIEAQYEGDEDCLLVNARRSEHSTQPTR